MQDYSDRELDAALVATIHHESFLMKISHDEFVRLGEKQILSGLSNVDQVLLFSSYTSFLHHLYELYIACFMRDQGSDEGFFGKGSYIKRDALFQAEASRIFKGFVDRIKSGQSEGWEHDISYYEIDIPDDFGFKFRKVRNSTAHAITERAEGEVDLSDFYNKYHKFVYELYRSVFRYWGRYNIEHLDMKAIGRFTVAATHLR